MMQLEILKWITLLNSRLPINQQLLTPLKESLESYVYPVGMIPVSLFRKELNYEGYKFIENINYIKPFIHFLYNDYYTTTEIDIISAYTIMHCTMSYILNDDILQNLARYLNVNSDKPDIQYCLDEIRYQYLSTLIYTHSTNTSLINMLMTALEPIENTHNSFNIRLKKNESV